LAEGIIGEVPVSILRYCDELKYFEYSDKLKKVFMLLVKLHFSYVYMYVEVEIEVKGNFLWMQCCNSK
jgi:hypothetical protein